MRNKSITYESILFIILHITTSELNEKESKRVTDILRTRDKILLNKHTFYIFRMIGIIDHAITLKIISISFLTLPVILRFRSR